MKSPLTEPPPRLRPRGWGLALALTGLFLGLALLPPFLEHGPRELLMTAYRPVCHQLPERSFAVGGVPLALCHRCTGVAGGLLLGVLLVPVSLGVGLRLARYDRWVLLAALAPLAVDWGGDVAGLWANTAWSRVLTGAAFGVAAGYVVGRGCSGRQRGRRAPVRVGRGLRRAARRVCTGRRGRLAP